MHSSVLKIVAAAGVTLFLAAPSWADNPGRHPAYLHALSDLRDARAHLQHNTNEAVDIESQHAIEHIDRAIGEIKKAAIMDGKNVDDHVKVDAGMNRPGRFHRSLELLDKARADVMGEEDQSDTTGLQVRVVQHIDRARNSVRHAIEVIEKRS
jgi:hypothetical protein